MLGSAKTNAGQVAAGTTCSVEKLVIYITDVVQHYSLCLVLVDSLNNSTGF